VHFIDEKDDLPLGFCNFLKGGFETLFEFTAVFRASNHGRHVELHNAFVFQALRHIAVDDALSQAFNDGGLTHARFAN